MLFESNTLMPAIYSYKQMSWLSRIEREQGIKIQSALSSEGEYFIKGVGCVDGYCASTNTVYEYHGDYWHGNPLLYEPDTLNPKTGTTFRQLFLRTVKRDRKIRRLGYNLVIEWETPINEEDYYAEMQLTFGDCGLRGENYLLRIASDNTVYESLSLAKQAMEVWLSKSLWLLELEGRENPIVLFKAYNPKLLEAFPWCRFVQRFSNYSLVYQEKGQIMHYHLIPHLLVTDKHRIRSLVYSDQRQDIRLGVLNLHPGNKSLMDIGVGLALYFLLFHDKEGKNVMESYELWRQRIKTSYTISAEDWAATLSCI